MMTIQLRMQQGGVCYDGGAMMGAMMGAVDKLHCETLKHDGILLASLSGPLVGVLAQHVFHYQGPDPHTKEEITANPKQARALGNALLVSIVFPWLLSGSIFTLLHFTYPRDKAKVQAWIRGKARNEVAME